MKVDRTTRAAHLRKPALWSTFVALIAMAAILFGLLAMNSTHAAHESGGTVVASGQRPHVGVEPVVAAVAVAAVAVAAHTGLGVLGCPDCILDCAILAITCTIVLVLASLIMLAWLPALYRRLLDAGGHIVRLLSGPTLDIYRPSLTVLSICRI
ncbi:hypothetical protein [Cryobacterium fucosi]|uniref:Uncharacterized protein n=1 Tax=Cryobacterium fucosi TaxID=1259157 RepID=A0A4R9B9R1_9MICO|nr:hypothetical protein [Cryobacterium fucosi]TFD79188.1 hypothetical protein E3T48_06335 [Cryobacterium fucosi]